MRYNKCDKSILTSYESIWGPITNQKDLVHFLLKYQWKDSPNWDRELHENYPPIMMEELFNRLDLDNYRILYFEHYILPYTKNRVLDEQGIDLKDNTHIKILLERVTK